MLFSGGCGRSMTNFHFLLGKDLEGKQIHQNVQKRHSGVGSKIKTLRQQIGNKLLS